MKRIICILALLLTLTFLGSCEKSSTTPESTESSHKVETTVGTEETTIEETETEIVETEEVSPREDCSFRNTVWGDSIEVVRASETSEFIGEVEDGLVYSGKISAYDCNILYQFNNGKLFNGGYLITDIFSAAGQYIDAYNSLKLSLVTKYGDAKEDIVHSNENDYLVEIAGDAKALEYGYTTYYAKWETDTTLITISMSAENYKVSIIIAYQDINYSNEISTDGF